MLYFLLGIIALMQVYHNPNEILVSQGQTLPNANSARWAWSSGKFWIYKILEVPQQER